MGGQQVSPGMPQVGLLEEQQRQQGLVRQPACISLGQGRATFSPWTPPF